MEQTSDEIKIEKRNVLGFFRSPLWIGMIIGFALAVAVYTFVYHVKIW